MFFYLSRYESRSRAIPSKCTSLGRVHDINSRQYALSYWLYQTDTAMTSVEAENNGIVLISNPITDRYLLEVFDNVISKKEAPFNILDNFMARELKSLFLYHRGHCLRGLIHKTGFEAASLYQRILAEFERGELALSNGRGYEIDSLNYAGLYDLSSDEVIQVCKAAAFTIAEKVDKQFIWTNTNLFIIGTLKS